jgi:hypothetical protein
MAIVLFGGALWDRGRLKWCHPSGTLVCLSLFDVNLQGGQHRALLGTCEINIPVGLSDDFFHTNSLGFAGFPRRNQSVYIRRIGRNVTLGDDLFNLCPDKFRGLRQLSKQLRVATDKL